MSDLSRALVDAAAEAVHARLCGCGGPVGDADEHIDTARVAVSAVLETLTDGIETANWPMSISRLRGLAAEVKTGEETA